MSNALLVLVLVFHAFAGNVTVQYDEKELISGMWNAKGTGVPGPMSDICTFNLHFDANPESAVEQDCLSYQHSYCDVDSGPVVVNFNWEIESNELAFTYCENSWNLTQYRIEFLYSEKDDEIIFFIDDKEYIYQRYVYTE